MDKTNNIGKDNYVLPISSGQERLWFLHTLDERLGAAYNMSTGFKIQKTVDRIALQKAVNFVVLRHEALRTAICKVDGVLRQVVDPHLMITVSYIDCITNGLISDVDAKVLKKMQLEAKTPFIFSSPGFVRFSLYRIQRDSFYFLIVLHHSIADGVSLEILIREIIICYQQILTQQKITLPELTYHFADIVAWQNKRITSDLEQEHTSYWKDKLNRANTSVQLSESKSRGGEPNFSGETLPFILDKNAFDRIVSMSKEIKVSPYCILFLAFALLVHYHSGQTDFLIGVPTVNRDYKETWPIIGYFANTVVIRVNVNEAITAKILLLQIHEAISESLSHQDLSISKIVDLLRPERSTSLGTIFQFMFSYQESNDIQSVLDNFGAKKILIDNGLSKFDIFLFLLNQNNSLEGFVEYSTEIFEKNYVLRLIKHYIVICNVLSENLSLSIYDTKLLDEVTKDEIFDRIKIAKENNNSNVQNDFSNVELDREKTQLESELEMIWQELLGIKTPIFIRANFFDLGGNSLLVTKMVDMINQRIKEHLPIKIIFLQPSIEKIALYIESLKNTPALPENSLSKIMELYESSELENMVE